MSDSKSQIRKKGPSHGVRLAARITGTIWVIIILFFNVGTLLDAYHNNGNHLVLTDNYLVIAILISLYLGLAGLIIACWRTLSGIILSSIGFLSAGLFLILDPGLNFNIFALLIVFIPIFLYFIYWRDTRHTSKE